MIVVADSGPLINLARVHRFNLLRDLYGEVLIPAEVIQEVVRDGNGLPGSTDVATSPWCHVIHPAVNVEAERLNYPQLGTGEVAAILHALRLKADLLLCDDLAARRVADVRGQRVKGTLGMLVEAKQRRLIPRVGDIIDELLRTGAWLNPVVAREAMRLAGE